MTPHQRHEVPVYIGQGKIRRRIPDLQDLVKNPGILEIFRRPLHDGHRLRWGGFQETFFVFIQFILQTHFLTSFFVFLEFQASMMRPATQLVASLSDESDFSAFSAGHPEDSINCVTSMPKPDMDGRAKSLWRQGLFSATTQQFF